MNAKENPSKAIKTVYSVNRGAYQFVVADTASAAGLIITTFERIQMQPFEQPLELNHSDATVCSTRQDGQKAAITEQLSVLDGRSIWASPIRF